MSLALSDKGRHVHTVKADDTAMQALSLMNQNRIGALVVEDGTGRIAGILTERDILRHVNAAGGSLGAGKVRELMTPRDKLIVATDSHNLDYVMQVMTRNRIRHVPVVDGDWLVGLLPIGDLVKCHLSDVEQENKFLHDYVTGRYLA
jgi:CBS domain-containing protein